MKVRVIKTPTMQYGGNLYDSYRLSPGEVNSLGMIGNRFTQGVAKMFGDVTYVSGMPKVTPYEYRPFNKTKNWNPENTKYTPFDPSKVTPTAHKPEYGMTGPTVPTGNELGQVRMPFQGNAGPIRMNGFQDGGNTSSDVNQTKAPVDPQLLQAYRVIGEALGGGEDPNTLVDQFVKEGGLSMEDATSVVQKVMEYLKPTNEEGMPMAQMGGINGGIFAGQSMQPNIIEKPLMKDGGYTYLTSQPAYTKKSVNYFGTSNAPARDSYTDNEEITTSVKAVPREDATIEAEKGEYIFSDRGLYKIEGKKHSQGGTPLAAKGGEFIFSAHKDMSLDHDLQKKSGLKVSSSKALAENTPAKVLERNVDVKEYNRLKSILESPKSDAITKKTAQFMLDKMNIKIDLISKLQEAKKQPAPTEIQDQYIEQSEIQKDIDEQKQYAYGGEALPGYQTGDEVKWVRKPDGTIGQIKTSNISKLDPTSARTSPYNKGKEVDERKMRLKQWYDAMVQAGYKGSDPTKDLNVYDPSKPNQQYSAIGELQAFTAQKFPDLVKDYIVNYATPSTKAKGILQQKGAKTLAEANLTDAEIADIFKDQYFDWRLPFTIGEKKEEFIPWSGTISTEEKKLPEPKKQYTDMVNDINIPDPYEQVKAMQFSQYANNLLANKPYFTYTPAINQPITVAPRQSTQPLENQAGLSRRIASRVGSRLQDTGAMQQALAKENEAVNDAFFRVGQYNAEQEAANYNQNLLRNAAAVNQFNQGLKQTHDLNSNVLDKMNYANAAYYNQYSTARQKDMLNRYYNQRDLLTTMIPYLDTYEVANPDGTYTKHMAAPIDVLTGQANPRWTGWNSKVVNDLTKQETEEDRLKAIQKYKELGYTADEINYIRNGKTGK
jgi:polyhydroxyalkanoate synthesis regulator phasin